MTNAGMHFQRQMIHNSPTNYNEYFLQGDIWGAD